MATSQRSTPLLLVSRWHFYHYIDIDESGAFLVKLHVDCSYIGLIRSKFQSISSLSECLLTNSVTEIHVCTRHTLNLQCSSIDVLLIAYFVWNQFGGEQSDWLSFWCCIHSQLFTCIIFISTVYFPFLSYLFFLFFIYIYFHHKYLRIFVFPLICFQFFIFPIILSSFLFCYCLFFYFRPYICLVYFLSFISYPITYVLTRTLYIH